MVETFIIQCIWLHVYAPGFQLNCKVKYDISVKNSINLSFQTTVTGRQFTSNCIEQDHRKLKKICQRSCNVKCLQTLTQSQVSEESKS